MVKKAPSTLVRRLQDVPVLALDRGAVKAIESVVQGYIAYLSAAYAAPQPVLQQHQQQIRILQGVQKQLAAVFASENESALLFRKEEFEALKDALQGFQQLNCLILEASEMREVVLAWVEEVCQGIAEVMSVYEK